MKRFLSLCALLCCSTADAESIRTTDGVSYTRAADGNFYRTELIRSGPTTPVPAAKAAPTYQLYYWPAPSGGCPTCPNGSCPMPKR